MHQDIVEKIKELKEAIHYFGDAECITINLFFNCEGLEITIKERTADQLKSEGVSMRNVLGDFIK